MKNVFLTVLTCFITLSMAVAQKSLEVRESQLAMSAGMKPGFTVTLTGMTQETVSDAWEAYLRDYNGKTKYSKKAKEFFTDDATIKKMSDNSVDIYSTVTEKDNDAQLTAWFDLGGAYLSSSMHPDKISTVQNMMKDFVLGVSKSTLEEEIKEQQKRLEKMEGELKGLEKDKASMERDIYDWENRIVDTRKKIEQNIKDQQTKNTEVKTQVENVALLKKRMEKF